LLAISAAVVNTNAGTAAKEYTGNGGVGMLPRKAADGCENVAEFAPLHQLLWGFLTALQASGHFRRIAKEYELIKRLFATAAGWFEKLKLPRWSTNDPYLVIQPLTDANSRLNANETCPDSATQV
jgi:hypothetical protein